MTFMALILPLFAVADPKPVRPRSIASHLALLCTAVAIPIFACASAVLWRYAYMEQRRLEHRSILSVREISETLDVDILSLKEILRTLATSSRIPANDLEAFYRSAAEVTRQTSLAIVLSDAQGHTILDTNYPLGTVLPDVDPGIHKVLETKQPLVTNLLQEPVTQLPLYAVAAPVFRYQTNEVTHVLQFNVSTQRVREILGRALKGDDVRASVIDRDGHILARSPRNEPSNNTIWHSFERAGQAKDGIFRHKNFMGVETLISFTRMRSTGWIVMSGVNAEVVDGPIRLLMWQLVGIAGLTALIAGLIGIVLSRRLLVSLEMLEANTIRIGHGEPLRNLLTPVLEVNRIGDFLAQSSRELQEANEAREALLYEVNHRVKNSLAVVTSILSLQARQTSDPHEKRGLIELRSRIDIIARVHQSLYESGHHNSINVGHFLKEVATTTMQALDSRLNCEISATVDADVIMPVYRTTPLALIASELITNAIKHAQKADGHCKITMRFARDGDQGLSLMIEDDGVGLDADFDPLRSGGVGMRIITGLLKQLRAKMTTNAGEPGARFLIILDEAHGE